MYKIIDNVLLAAESYEKQRRWMSALSTASGAYQAIPGNISVPKDSPKKNLNTRRDVLPVAKRSMSVENISRKMNAINIDVLRSSSTSTPPATWHDINILSFFLSNPFIHLKKSSQNATSHNITRYLRENGAINSARRQICKKKTFIFREFHTSSFYTFTDQYSQQALEGQKRTFRERKNIAAFIKKEFDKKSRIKLNECCLYQEEYAFKLCRLLQRTFERKLIRRNALERKNQRRKFESSTTQDDFPETSDQYVPMTTIPYSAKAVSSKAIDFGKLKFWNERSQNTGKTLAQFQIIDSKVFSPDKDIYEAFNSNIGLWIDPNKVILQPDSGDASIYTIGFDLNINKEVVSKFNFGVKQGDKFVNPVDDLILILKLKNGPDHYITLSGN
ncbi:Oidioi.mRNA.OKI2018_I69.PAR.g12838.t1.cds [Oikopleura dioica]|uniref:Oidioi.mRNA.OKI2018_I69.PAR.g12838.t1.cds n=1 Tax=Oikopleura dioica TaxID=34765 RepID=A0ABN7S6E3_OIKDI|nr:Oidioi.mRNA.OKI2018_I69.PAR.g12838.t1.cds [Oikopleura dioica]